MHSVFHVSAVGSSTDEEGGDYSGAEASAEGPGAEEHRMEERKRKARNLLSKLHDDAPCLAGSNNCPSNFEDCEHIISLLFTANPLKCLCAYAVIKSF